MNGDHGVYLVPHSVSEEEVYDVEDNGWLSSDDDKVEYTIEYFGNGVDGEPEGECLIVSPMTFQIEDNYDDDYYSDPEFSETKQNNPIDQQDADEAMLELRVSCEDVKDDNQQKLGNDEENDREESHHHEITPMQTLIENCNSTHDQLQTLKEKHEKSLRLMEESIETRITEATQSIQEGVQEAFSELQEIITSQQIEIDMEISLRESAETENETLKGQIVVMKRQIEEDALSFSDLLEENEKLKHEVKIFRERNVALKHQEIERQKEIQRLKGDITIQQLEYRDMIEENKRGKKNEEVFKLEKQKLATQKKVLSRELDIHFYRNSISGNSFDKTSVESMKETPVNFREKELEKEVQILRKRMEALQPNLDTLKDLYFEQISNMKELVDCSKKLVHKLEDETTTKIELRKSMKRDFEKEHLRMEYQRLTKYDSEEEEFDSFYNEQEKQYNRLLREKDKQLEIFRVAYDGIVYKTEERRQVLETEFDSFLQIVKDLQQPKTIDEDEIIENLLRRSSSPSSPTSAKPTSPRNSILSTGQPKSFMISRFQKDAVKQVQGRQRSQSYSDFGSRNSDL
ncbi:predicted protein [Naegleria gruberi]|uniref:Predicted protein n=1 Tax=Naegleria gruberi TaxID=5762 RepID=D2VFM7_NAEGR|nr:uncharacterized protein NAEGRDRAFT_67679 [Naegleria gruberi]EFC44498.1 predicted protein [Naegleria gruberi]|eukprot:XP_002677242.1 predicted protein [Naegleria gruberi strain NEG-M]